MHIVAGISLLLTTVYLFILAIFFEDAYTIVENLVAHIIPIILGVACFLAGIWFLTEYSSLM